MRKSSINSRLLGEPQPFNKENSEKFDSESGSRLRLRASFLRSRKRLPSSEEFINGQASGRRHLQRKSRQSDREEIESRRQGPRLRLCFPDVGSGRHRQDAREGPPLQRRSLARYTRVQYANQEVRRWHCCSW